VPIKEAKKRRQILMITHNPNLAVAADAEQVIRVDIRKDSLNEFTWVSGGIENLRIKKAIVDVLEGTMPAFQNRSRKDSD
jgi:DNA repair ATPase RecN